MSWDLTLAPCQHGRMTGVSRHRDLPAALLLMSRPAQLALIGLVYASGVILGLIRGATPGLDVVLAGGIVLLVSAVSVHLANEYVDVDTDAITHRTPFSGGSGVLPRGLVDRRVALLGLLAAVLLAVGAALLLVQWSVLPITAGAILLFGLAGGLAYSVPPVAASRRGVGEFVNAGLGGMLLPLYGVAVARGYVEILDAIAFMPFALVVFLSVMATAWSDRVADAAVGKRTLQTRVSRAGLRRIHAVVIVLFVAAETVSALLRASPAAPITLAVVPLLVAANRRYTVVTNPVASVAAMVLAVLVPTLVLVVSVVAHA